MKIRSDEGEIYGVSTECICPRCRKIHRRKLWWIGRGKPRKFCEVCTGIVSEYECFEAPLNSYAVRSMIVGGAIS